MEIAVKHVPLSEIEADAIVMFNFAGEKPQGELAQLDENLGGTISKLVEDGEISGKYREFTMLHTNNIKTPRVLIMGIGERNEFDVDKVRSMCGRSARILRRIKIKHIAYSSFTGLGVDAVTAAKCISEGVILGLYHFKKYITTRKNKEPVGKITILAKDAQEAEELEKGRKLGVILAQATCLSRDLSNEPANIMTPAYFVDQCREVAGKLNLGIDVFDEKQMQDLGMEALLAVAKGSDVPPRTVVLKYEGNPGGQVLGLIGKGITFDAGGLSIKPADSMYRMYNDCSGACSVLGAIKAIAEMKLPVNVTAVMGMAENIPSAKSYHPGDIINSMSGKTIEILNTDAEGRLLLADILTLAIRNYKADYLVDIATLTGGCVVALGVIASAILGNDQDLINKTFRASEVAAEKLWQLPLFEEYLAQIHSDVADLENSGGRGASTSTAAKFLEQFVEKKPWVHLDIAGTAMIERERTAYLKKPYLPKEGATGVGVRTMYHLAELMAKK